MDWGLGHATRCIPIIREISEQGHEPVLAADGRAYDLLNKEFPNHQLIRLQGYRPEYHYDSMVFSMFLQSPRFLATIRKEQEILKTLIRKEHLNGVISDNRYGLSSTEIPAVFMTHQLFIRMPPGMQWMENLVNRLNHFFIKKYQSCWVPDVAGSENLSGELSHGKKISFPVEYIGMLSRLNENNAQKKYDLLALLSGPEPQRTFFENSIIRQAKELPLKTLIVQGKTEREMDQEKQQLEKIHEYPSLSENVCIVSHLTSENLNQAIAESELVVCRSGYSSLMDLAAMRKKSILIPTPGQTEQEYLAKYFTEKKYAIAQKQSAMNLREAVEKIKKTELQKIPFEGNQFQEVIRRFLETG